MDSNIDATSNLDALLAELSDDSFASRLVTAVKQGDDVSTSLAKVVEERVSEIRDGFQNPKA